MPDPLERMEALIERWGPNDRRSIFAGAYGTMTANMLAALDAGRFGDEAWVAQLLDRFADYYFDAVDAYDGDVDRCPTVWRRAFDACGEEALHPLRVLFLGINAHINYDLAFTLADVLSGWVDMDEETRRSMRREYDTVNEVIEGTVDVVQATVVTPVAPAMGVLDRLLGPIDEWVFSSLVADWRGDAWADAIALLESPPQERPAVTDHIERRALRVADQVIRIGPG